MEGSWQPQEDSLRQILQLLKEAQSPDNSKQREVFQNFGELKKDPVVNNYLIFVLTKLTSEGEMTRSLSGLFLKKNIQDDFQNFPPAVVNYIRNECLSGLGDSSPRIRATVAVIVKTIASTGELNNWPDLLPKLCQMLNSTENPEVCRGALGALQMVCEVSMGDLLQGLMLLAADNDVEVRKNVCAAFVSLVPLMDGIVECMLDLTKDANDAVALGACKLWLSLAMNETICRDVLNQQHLANLLPLLLKWMRFSDKDIIQLKDDFDEDGEDHHDSDEEDEGDDDSDDDDALSDPNLWSSSACTLGQLSNVFNDELLPILLPSLKEMLHHPEGTMKVSGILALGAIAEGCENAMAEAELVELVITFLISCLSEEKAFVRGFGCMALSGIGDWLVGQPQFFAPLITELLKRVLDENKHVQEATCSALATIQEEAGTHLAPYLGDILETLVRAYDKYHQKNLTSLYNVIETMTRSLGSHLNKKDYINLLMPPLIAKFNALQDDDKDLMPLMECLASVAEALQSGFLPYLNPLFCRCITIVDKTLNHQKADKQQLDQFQAPDKDCMRGAFYLLSCLTVELGSHVEGLIVPSKMMQLLHQSMQDLMPEVRQYSFALLCCLTKECFDHVLPCLPEFLPILGQNLNNPESDSDVCFSATFALGEIIIKLGNEIHNYIPLFLTQLISIINRPDTPKDLLENTALILGLLGHFCARDVAPHLDEFAQRWFMSMRKVQDQEEKKSAFRGMCNMMTVNEHGIEKDYFVLFCNAVTSWPNPPSDLKEQFVKILKSFKRSAGEEGWKELTEQFPPPLREQMEVQYGI